MKLKLFTLLLAGVNAAAQPAAHASLARQIDRAIAENPVARSAAWGIQATELPSGKTLVALNAGHFFVPASNTKLFSTSLALTKLGPDFTFQTRVMAAAAPDANGCDRWRSAPGGRGDPNLSGARDSVSSGTDGGRSLGRAGGSCRPDRRQGVTRINGDIVGDDRWYVWEPFGAGWGIDDPYIRLRRSRFGAHAERQCIYADIRPGASEGDLAALELNPPVEYYTIDNRVRTTAGGERRIHYSRAPGSMTLELWGTVPLQNKGEDLNLGIEDPARYAALAFRQLLQARGIVVGGSAVAGTSFHMRRRISSRALRRQATDGG